MVKTWGIRALAQARRADHAWGRAGGRRRVLVDVRTPMNLVVLAPMWEALGADERLDVRFTGPDRDDLAKAFAEAGVSERVVSREFARRRRWDLYMNADPWDAATLWRCRSRVNFFHGVAGKYNLECPAGLALDFDRYDRVAFPNEGRLRRYLEAKLVTREQAVLVGFPKLDRLVKAHVSARDAAAAVGLPPDRPTAIYAPTFAPESSLLEHGVAIAERLLEGGFNVIVKLHDRSLDPEPRYSGGVNWPQQFAPLAAGGRCHLARQADSTPYLLAAEIMVTDHSTIGFEFCALDRPLIVFDVPALIAAARVDEAKVHLLRAAAEVVDSADAVVAAARRGLEFPTVRAGARAAAVREVFHDAGGATERALALCYQLLEYPAPATQEALGTVTS